MESIDGQTGDSWSKEIVLAPASDLSERLALVKNLYDKTVDRMNHTDKLRQQNVNFGIIVFSGLLAFTMKTTDERMQYVGCAGIMTLMLIFCLIDSRLHKYLHGYTLAMLNFPQIQARLLADPIGEVRFLQYDRKGEADAKFWRSRNTWLFLALMVASLLLGLVIFFWRNSGLVSSKYG